MLELNEVLVKACASDPHKRYQTAEAMHADLALLRSGKSIRRLRLVEKRLASMTKLGVAVSGIAIVAAAAFFFQRIQTRQTEKARSQIAQANAQPVDTLTQLEIQRAEDLKGHRQPVWELGFNPDNDTLISISPDELRPIVARQRSQPQGPERFSHHYMATASAGRWCGGCGLEAAPALGCTGLIGTVRRRAWHSHSTLLPQ